MTYVFFIRQTDVQTTQCSQQLTLEHGARVFLPIICLVLEVFKILFDNIVHVIVKPLSLTEVDLFEGERW